jgi:DEAD/DEAH box helicase domain-containing protein
MADKYPLKASRCAVHLRSLCCSNCLPGTASTRSAEVDYESALWMVHPQAIYLHSGQMYEVQQLDLENRTALLKPGEVDYYTEPVKRLELEKLSLTRQQPVAAGTKNLGEMMVTTQVTGFRRIRWFSNEVLDEGELDLPATQLRTTGYWLTLDPDAIDQLRESGLWNSDPNNYGPGWPLIRKMVLQRDRYACQACGAVEGERPLMCITKRPCAPSPHSSRPTVSIIW